MFTNNFIKNHFAVQNSSCYNFSYSAINVVVIIVSFLFWQLHIFWVVVLTVNRSICVELITFCISEWLAVFSYVISICFLVPFDRQYKPSLRTVHSTATHIMHCLFRTQCDTVIHFFLHELSTVFLLWCFTVVNKHNVVQVGKTFGLGSSVSE